MTPLRLLLWPAVLLTLTAAPAQAQAPANCALANAVDFDAYTTLAMTQWSEADQDGVSFDWAECRAAKLDKELAANPQLRARLNTLRKQYRELRAIEGQLAYIRNGGGTMYSHGIPRMFPGLEEQLASLSALARSPLGARTGQHYAQVIAQARKDVTDFVKTSRAYKPKPDENFGTYDPQEWKKLVDRYEQVGKAIMLTLGSRNDAATALGYSMLNTFTFPATDEMN